MLNGTVRWVEVCCRLRFKRSVRIGRSAGTGKFRTRDAPLPDQNGSEPWACGECDCTERLEKNPADETPSSNTSNEKWRTGRAQRLKA